MKKALLALLLVTIAVAPVANAQGPASPAPRKFVGGASEKEKAEFERIGGERHKWKKGLPLPASLSDAGLLSDATVVWTALYLDGATKGYLFKDSTGNYLAVCTGPGLQAKDHPQRIDAPVNSRVFIGALHYTGKEAQMVDAGSKCEAFLSALISQTKAR